MKPSVRGHIAMPAEPTHRNAISEAFAESRDAFREVVAPTLEGGAVGVRR
jgi:hypothetical protein